MAVMFIITVRLALPLILVALAVVATLASPASQVPIRKAPT
jgi:hypothetical protein